jgi:hypothetical protein
MPSSSAQKSATVTDDLGVRIETSTGALLTVRSKLTEISPVTDVLRLFAPVHPEPDVSTEDAKSYLAAIQAKYAMGSERQLHDELIASLASGTDGTIVPVFIPAPDPNPQVDDPEGLDDILF